MDQRRDTLEAVANAARAIRDAAARHRAAEADALVPAYLYRALDGALEALDEGEVPAAVPPHAPWDLATCGHGGCTRHATEPGETLCYPCRSYNCQCVRATAPDPWWPRHGPSGPEVPGPAAPPLGLQGRLEARLRSGPFAVGE